MKNATADTSRHDRIRAITMRIIKHREQEKRLREEKSSRRRLRRPKPPRDSPHFHTSEALTHAASLRAQGKTYHEIAKELKTTYGIARYLATRGGAPTQSRGGILGNEQKAISLREKGHTLRQIAASLRISYPSVRYFFQNHASNFRQSSDNP